MDIKIARTSLWSIGTKNWYVLQADDGKQYQRWSHLMDSTDETLMLAVKGDTLDVEIEDVLRGADTVNSIKTAKFK